MLSLFGIFLVLVASLVFIQYLKLQWATRRLPPGPTPFPIIGTLWQMNFEFSHENLMKLAQRHGNICTIWVGHFPLIVLNGFQAVKEGLTAHPEDVSGRLVSPFYKRVGKEKGIIFTSGHVWKQQRRIGVMSLKNLGLGKKGLESRIHEEAQHLSEVFANSKGQPLDPSFHIILAVSNVICAVVFGHRFSEEDKTFQQLIKKTNDLLRVGGGVWHNLYDMFPSLMEHCPGPLQKAFSSVDFLHSVARNEIRNHKQNEWSMDDPQDFIDFYLAQIAKNTGDPTSTLDESNLVQSIFDFFLAGTETTATTMRWAVLYMVAYPDIQGKVQKELDAVLGSSQLICYEDRKKMPYTNAVIHEVQRFANIVAVGVPRLSTKDTTLLGFPVPKGTIILPNLSSTLLDSKEWETPRRFNPGHFLDQDGNFVNREAFLPFSAGHRVCLGEQLARMELFIFFTRLMRTFTFQLPEGVKEINMESIKGLTLLPHPYDICAVPR
ncbi:cytochrome P450 2J2-like [Hemicordylus capensis]|uniref:cytochrome P450 2J2-like n=1 Tax=Hemicordylus capensis TaxID=884348 RepID=UPI00230261A3|nr:cytochrome P450 2J2-like [Hemicordylus capensis]